MLGGNHDAFKNLGGARHLVLFAMKANSSGAILSLFGKAGAGADIVSIGELYRARRAGIPPERIVFSGVGKRADDLLAAVFPAQVGCQENVTGPPS